MRTDAVIAGVAAVAIGGAIGPILFPMASAAKTACYVSSIVAASSLAFGERTGLFDRLRDRDKIVRESDREIWIQRLASHEALQQRQIEIDELVETLVMIDDLSPIEQLHFLKQLDLAELMPIYQESRMLKQAEMEPAIEVPVTQIVESEEFPYAPVSHIMPDRIFFPVADLARELAQSDRQLVEVSCPGGGKTRFQIAFAAAVHDLSQGQAQCIVIDAKGSPFAKLGIKHYLHCNEPETIPMAWALVSNAIEIMISRQNRRTALGGEYKSGQAPPELLIILGELNDLLELAIQYDAKHRTDYSDRLMLAVSRIFRQGREDKVRILADMHSFNAGDLKAKKQKISAAMFANAAKLALSRNGDATVIDKFLSYYSQAGDEAVKQMRMKLDEYQSECPDKKIPIVATSLGGLRIVQLPAVELNSLYRDWQAIDFKAVGQNESNSGFDSAYKAEHGIDPDVEIALDEEEDYWDDTAADDDRGISKGYMDHLNRRSKPQAEQSQQQPQSTIPPESPLAFLVATLKQWIAELPLPPTDAQLKQKLLEVTGQNFSDKALQGLKAELGL